MKSIDRLVYIICVGLYGKSEAKCSSFSQVTNLISCHHLDCRSLEQASSVQLPTIQEGQFC